VTEGEHRRGGRGRLYAVLALLGVALLTLLVRCLGFEWVFVGDEVVFPPGDAQYHLRRSLYTFVNWPSVLLWDSYINFPDGAAISWPPLFDFVLGTVGRMLAADARQLEYVAAFAPPVFGVLTVILVYLIARVVGSRAEAILAACFFALLPMSVNFTRLGNADHHCSVALIGAWLLLLCMRVVGCESASRRSWLLLGMELTVARAALLFTWHGSLLYLALVEGTLLLGAALRGRRALFALEGLSALATAALLVPFILTAPTPLGGPYSAIALSRLHLIAVLVTAAVGLALWLIESRWPARSAPVRIAWVALAGLAALGLALLAPGLRQGLEPALRFVTMSDGVGLRTGEQFPLFAFTGRAPVRAAELSWGYFAYLIPLAPLAAVLAVRRGPRVGPAALVLALWTGFFGVMAIFQRRYGNDFGPGASVAFALLLSGVGRSAARLFGRGPRLAGWLAASLLLALLIPPIASLYLPRAHNSIRALRGELADRDRATATVGGSLMRFCRELRRVTPETSGFLDPKQTPEYGVVAHANLGHAIQYIGRRPTPTDPFWAFIGRENWDHAFALLEAETEAEALDRAEKLRARYVVTTPSSAPSGLEGRLHHGDGLGGDSRLRLEHFRLVAEGPRGGKTIGDIFGQRRRGGEIPYKLFEIVSGAVLEAKAPPGTAVVARLNLATTLPRRISFQARAVADEEGLARLRVAYPSEGGEGGEEEAAVRAIGVYRVQVGQDLFKAAVSLEQVRSGARVPVTASGSGEVVGRAASESWIYPIAPHPG